jgi:hypothetical protein
VMRFESIFTVVIALHSVSNCKNILPCFDGLRSEFQKIARTRHKITTVGKFACVPCRRSMKLSGSTHDMKLCYAPGHRLYQSSQHPETGSRSCLRGNGKRHTSGSRSSWTL